MLEPFLRKLEPILRILEGSPNLPRAINIDNNRIDEQKSIISGIGRIRDVNQGPDGYLYLITSNTDGKAFPNKNDDKLLRITK